MFMPRRTTVGCLAVGARSDDDSGTVGASDLLALLANWGPCP